MISTGEQIGRYKIRSAIGKGGMGEVFLAEDTELERLVALKVLPEDLANDTERMRRFVQEAKSASALNRDSNASMVCGAGRTAWPSALSAAKSASVTFGTRYYWHSFGTNPCKKVER